MNISAFTSDHPWCAYAGRRREAGFTLLEMMMVMFITTLLMTAVFGIVNALTQLTQDLTTSQQRDARKHAFVELCSRSLRNLPPNAMMRLRTRQEGGLYTTELALGDAPSLLSASAGPFTILETETTVDGYLRLVVRSLSEEQLLAWEMGDKRLGTRVVLLENVRMLEWLVFQPQTRQWISVWNEGLPLTALREPARSAAQPERPQTPGETPSPPPAEVPQQVQEAIDALGRPQRPTLVELRFALGIEPPQRWVFWVPPRVAGK